MKQFVARLVLIASAMTFSGAAFAGECPVSFGNFVGGEYADQVVKSVEAAKTCYSASTIAEDCAMGSSIDVPIAAAATAVCVADFKAKLSSAETKSYQALVKKCVAKYAKMEGTMYMASKAFCVLDVARLYSQLYTPAE